MQPLSLSALTIMVVLVSGDFETDVISPLSSLSFRMKDLTQLLPVPQFNMETSYRDLQSFNTKPPLSSTMICDGLNQLSSLFNCTCEEFGDEAVRSVCELIAPLCDDTNTTCLTGTFERYFVPMLGNQTAVNATFSCTSVPTSDTPEAKTCIRVFPKSPGDFSEIASCSAQYQPDANSEPVTCASCEMCPGDTNTDGGENMTTASISLNCCNVVTDVKQTCQPIQPMGEAFPLWDVIPPGQEGQCSAAATGTTWIVRTFWMAIFYGAIAALQFI